MRTALSALTLCLTLSGCRDEPATSGAAPTVETSEKAIVDAVEKSEKAIVDTVEKSPADDSSVDAVGTEPPIVRVLDAGREPRRVLDQPPVAGERDVELAMDLASLSRTAGAPSTMLVSLRWSTSAAADVPSRFAVQRGEMKMGGSEMSDAEKKVVDAIVEMYSKVAGEAHRRGPGHVEVVQTKGAATRPSVAWMLHAFSVAPPTEALGIGAKWTTESKSEASGQPCTESRTYEITAMDAQQITAALAIEQRCGGGSAPSTSTMLKGDLQLAPNDALAIAGEIAGTHTMAFPAAADDPEPMPAVESKLGFRLTTRE